MLNLLQLVGSLFQMITLLLSETPDRKHADKLFRLAITIAIGGATMATLLDGFAQVACLVFTWFWLVWGIGHLILTPKAKK